MSINDEKLEELYENVASNEPKPVQRRLLPIKTKTALIPQAIIKNQGVNI